MPLVLIVTILLHAGSSLFWLLSSFVLARSKGQGAPKMFRWQTVAAVLAVFSGGRLWSLLHQGLLGTPEMLLIGGAACAVIAAGVQGMMVGASVRKLAAGKVSSDEAYRKITLGYRLSAGLLAVALLTMVAAPQVARSFPG